MYLDALERGWLLDLKRYAHFFEIVHSVTSGTNTGKTAASPSVLDLFVLSTETV